MEVGKRWIGKHPTCVNNVLSAFRTAGALIIGNAFLAAFGTDDFTRPAMIFVIGLLLVVFSSPTYIVKPD